MNAPVRKPTMTREQFFHWVSGQDARHEFDGFMPVAMGGATLNHSQIALNIHRALYARLHGTGCRALGTDAGIATIGDTVRYPDALITCTKAPGKSYLAPSPIVVFEIISPNSGRTDRIVKLREYQAVPSILRYVIVESGSVGLTVLARLHGDDIWAASALTAGELLSIPEVGAEIAVDDFFEAFDPEPQAPSSGGA